MRERKLQLAYIWAFALLYSDFYSIFTTCHLNTIPSLGWYQCNLQLIERSVLLQWSVLSNSFPGIHQNPERKMEKKKTLKIESNKWRNSSKYEWENSNFKIVCIDILLHPTVNETAPIFKTSLSYKGWGRRGEGCFLLQLNHRCFTNGNARGPRDT